MTYQICARCIMDTSDPDIRFDRRGFCNRCEDFLAQRRAYIVPAESRKRALRALVERIKRDGRGRPYECVAGISGGIDSTYAVYLAHKLGLRILAVHLDNGWNSELAVANIEKCLTTLGIDLYTHVVDWDEFRDLQLAFLKASTPDAEVPTDQAIVALLRNKAAADGIRWILTGDNSHTEGIAVPAWSSGQRDWRYVRSVHARFGTMPLRTYPHCGLLDITYYHYVLGQRWARLLDYVEYDKPHATEVLQRELGWRPYQGKHHESIYTRFYQCYFLPRKFGYDKRRLHLSTLVIAGQISREDALREMAEPPCSDEVLREDRQFVLRKLQLTEAEFDALMALPKRSFWDFPSYEKLPIVRVRRALKRWWGEGRARLGALHGVWPD